MNTETKATKILIRPSKAGDIAAIAEIYGHHVLNGLASFELMAPSVAEMGKRRADIIGRKFPYLAAETDGRVVGYAYASLYRTRPAYRFALEDSVYIHKDHAGRGIGKLLLGALVEACEKIGCRQLIAVIGDSDNKASIQLHLACGFKRTGTLKAVGFKFGGWVDSVLMQRAIGAGSKTLPPDGVGARIPAPDGNGTKAAAPDGGNAKVPAPDGRDAKIPAPVGGDTKVPALDGGDAKVPAPVGHEAKIPVPASDGIGVKPPPAAAGE